VAIVNPPVISLLLAFAVGFLASGPTFLWQGKYQLRSIQMYASRNEPARAHWSMAENWWYVTRYYFDVAMPERVAAVALVLGIGLALLRRDRALWPLVVGAAAAFIAQPPRMLTCPHHILPWMPFLTLLPACAAAGLYRAASSHLVSSRAARVALLLVVLGGTLLLVRDRLSDSKVDRSGEFARCRAVEDMTCWLEQNTPPDADIYLAFNAFNDQVFYHWMESEGVRVPVWCRKTSRHYYPWWEDRASLHGQSGFLACAESDLERMARLNELHPIEGIDPHHEHGFKVLQSFAAHPPETITAFHFDFRVKKR
jgi:hypothetical protein